MSTLERIRSRRRQPTPELLGQTVVVNDGSALVGLAVETGSVVTADPDDPAALSRFFDGLSGPLERVVVAGGRRTALDVARSAAGKIGAGGTLELAGAVDPRFAAALAAALAPVRIRVTVTGATVDVDGGRQLLARAA